MSIFNYFVVCLLAFHQLQSGEPREVNLTNGTRIPDRPRIIGGPFARPGEIKYTIVTLHDDQYYMCGGGIIDEYHILMAAHCFLDDKDRFDVNKVTVVAGTSDYKKKYDRDRVEVAAERVYVHKNYRYSTLLNDIAVLKLKTPLPIVQKKLEVLSLPTESLNTTGRMALMAGFGKDWVRKVRNSKNELEVKYDSTGYLRKADVLIYSNRECQKLYPDDKIYKTHLCGKMMKEDERKEYGICNGDSGSPLVLSLNETKTVVAIVSWSYGCDERKVPMVYTRVQKYLDFIEEAKNSDKTNARVKDFE